MIENYKRDVLRYYQKRKAEADLPPSMTDPTPASLRDECLSVFQERVSDVDDKVLRGFFGPLQKIDEYEGLIKRTDLDKYKPLINFLRGQTSTTEMKNIELLAWLIDYQKRPYGREEINEMPTNKEQGRQVNPSPPGEKKSKKRAWVYLLLFIPIVAALWWQIGPNESSPESAVAIRSLLGGGSEDCMYWDGERYKRIACEKELPDKKIEKIDQDKLAHFRKITDTDTLTERSIGKVWYTTIRGVPEYYTQEGFHPVYASRRLKPLTQYIINKYVYKTIL